MSSNEADARSIPILLPDLGGEGQSVRFAQWLVNHGDRVLQHDRVAEVLVGGVLFHVTSPAEGTVHHAIDSDGAILQTGDSLGSVHAEAIT